jgi:NADH-quinone oxidoreductase subunit J
MPWDVLIFYLIATVCVLSAGGVVVANNPVHSAIFLVLCFVNIAATFVMLGAEFLAVVQVIVYTGAILVLVLFVLMLVDPDELPGLHAARPVQRYVGLLLGAILLLEVGAAIATRNVTGEQGTATAENIAAVGGNTQALGRQLYTEYLLAFEVVSLVLLVAVVGAIVLALPERLGERPPRDRRATISLSHPRGVDAALPAGSPAGETPIPDAVSASPTRPAGAVPTGDAREVPAGPTPTGVSRELVMTRDADAYGHVGTPR